MDVERHDQTGAVKLRRSDPLERVPNRQIEFLDRHVTRVVKTNQHAAVVYKLFQALYARLADAACVLGRQSAGRIAIQNLGGCLRWKDHCIELRTERALSHISITDRSVWDVKGVKDVTRPALIHVAHRPFVNP